MSNDRWIDAVNKDDRKELGIAGWKYPGIRLENRKKRN
jgi:hypothetical protein